MGVSDSEGFGYLGVAAVMFVGSLRAFDLSSVVGRL